MGVLRFLVRASVRSVVRASVRSVVRAHRQARSQQTDERLSREGADQYRNLPAFPPTGELKGRCYVIDGDTIIIKHTKIRLAGIDAPELDQPWGHKAKWAMVNICKGQMITAELTGERSHDRLVATCYLPDGRDIGAELIKQGLALDWAFFSNGKYRHLEPEGVRRKLMHPRFRS